MDTYSVILMDIDGTLMDSSDRVSGSTKHILRRLEDRGIPIVLCSARSPSGVELAAREAELKNSPIVCCGGSLILDAGRSIIEDTGIRGEDALAFKEFAVRGFPGVTVSTYMYDIWLVDTEEDPNVQLVSERGHCAPVAGDLRSALQSVSHVHKLLCMGPPARLTGLQTAAAGQFPQLEFARSGTIYLEVMAKGVSKYTAMECIRRYYDVDIGRIAAFGDYYVDMEMLRYAGLGIAMGNAPEEVKAAADMVTASSDEKGVYIALKRLKFTPPGKRP